MVRAMKFSTYLKRQKIEVAEAASALKVTPRAIRYWRDGQVPRPRHIKAITEWSRGHVSFKDFF